MTGYDLRDWRIGHGVSVEDLADAVGATVGQVGEWEEERYLKRYLARRLRFVVWELYRDREIRVAGIPRCAWVEERQQHSMKEYADHLQTCGTCQQTIAFVDQNLEPPPPPPGLLAQLTHYGAGLPGWKRSAFAGGMLLVYMAGLGAPIILLIGIGRGDLLFALGAFALLGILFAGGAAGGVAHYLTTRIRATGSAGYYLSWILVLYAYLVAVGGILYVGEIVLGTNEHVFDPSDMATWIAFVVTGLLGGLIVGYSARERRAGGSSVAGSTT